MRTALTLGKYRRSCRLYCHYFYIRILGFQIFTDTCDGSACTNTCHEDIYLSVSISPDFRSCCFSVDGRVCRVLKLSWNKAVFIFFGKFIRFGNSSVHAFGSVCQNDFCTVRFQNISSFHTHCLRHGKNYSVSFDRCKGSKTDSCVSGCRLNDHCARFQNTFLFCIFDHAQCDTVLCTSCRVKILKFHQHLCFQSQLFFNISNFKERCISNQFCCILINFSHEFVLPISY